MDDFLRYFNLMSAGYLDDLVSDIVNDYKNPNPNKVYADDVIVEAEYTVQDDSCKLLLEEN